MTVRTKTKAPKKPDTPFTLYDQNGTHYRIGIPYAVAFLEAKGWVLDSDGFIKDPVKGQMSKDIETAFWQQIIRDTTALQNVKAS